MVRARLNRPAARAGAFVLIEVLVALTILGIASAAFMQSFTLSLSAARRMEVVTQASFFTRQLLDEFEIFPPKEGRTEGGFGDAYKNYYYVVELELIDPGREYRRLEPPEDVEQFFALKQVHLEIYYDDGQHQIIKAAEVDSAIIGLEKFSPQSKRSYLNY